MNFKLKIAKTVEHSLEIQFLHMHVRQQTTLSTLLAINQLRVFQARN